MKSNIPNNRTIKEHLTGPVPRTVTTTEERLRQRQQDKDFIKAMNEFTAKAGLLSDDPFFGGL